LPAAGLPAETVAAGFAIATPLEAPAEASAAPAPANVESPADYEVAFPGAPRAEAAPEAIDESAYAIGMAPAEPAAASETGFGFMPLVEEDEAVDRSARTTEPKFTTASMWTGEEARFAAIDIEASPVAEPAAASEAPAAAAESFVFEEATSAYITQPNMPVEAAAPVEAVEPVVEPAPVLAPVLEEAAAIAPPAQEAPAPAVASAVELSPALIDEIVRRVVAQLSESVVREIAWEVVPDCVERIIKDMAAREVSKR
jgi:hypothetical protein